MKLNHSRWLFLFILSIAVASNATVNMTISPPAVSNTYAGTITLQVSGITNGEAVVIQKYLDVNGNGVVDGGDILWQQFKLTDGKANIFLDGATVITNANTPGDTDATSGHITAALNLHVSGFEQSIVANYLFVLSSPFGNFTPITNTFAVTNFPFGQSLSGSVIANGTNVPNAAVLLFQPVGNNFSPQGGTVADASGNYQISVPPGFYVPVAFKSNFVANTGGASVTMSNGVNISTNLALMNADRSISGSFLDASNSVGIAGILVPVESQNGLLTVAFTDTNGSFTAPVTSDQWKVESSDQALAFKNYLRPGDKVQVDATAGSVSGVTISVPKANALFYGFVKDGFGQPMPNTVMFSQESNNNGNNGFEQDDTTYANGQYFAGALSETNGWQVQVSSDQALTNYIYSSPAFDDNGGTNLNVGQALRVDITALLATNIINGHVQDSTNNPISNVAVYASATISGVNFQQQTMTDGSGNYSMNVANGNWYVSLSCQGGNNSLDNIFGPGNYQCPGNQSVNINNNNGTANFTVNPCLGVQITTGSLLPSGHVGQFYSFGLSGSSCSGFLNWSVVSNTPPPGINIDVGGVLNGTPGTSGTYNFMVQANDGNGHSTNQNFSLTINSLSPTISPPAKFGSQFQFFVTGTSGQNYTVQMSTNLHSTNWSTLLITNPTMNSFFIVDTNATNPARFYRVLVGP